MGGILDLGMILEAFHWKPHGVSFKDHPNLLGRGIVDVQSNSLTTAKDSGSL